MKKGWETKRLLDFAVTVSTGPFGSVLHKSDYVDDGVPLVNPINMVDEGIVPDPSKLISLDTKRRLSSYVLKTGDVIVARRGEIGRCAVIGPREHGWVCGTGSFFVRPSAALDSQFLAQLIRSNGYREKLEQLSTGTTMRSLSNTALANLPISVPPLAEQQRIVGVLNEAFVNLATAQAHAEKNLKNARALFKSHVQSVFTHHDKGWVEKPLVDVCELFRDSAHRTPKYSEDGIPALRPRDVVNGILNLSEALRVPEAEYEIQAKRYKPRPGDIVYSRELSYGWAAMIPDSPRVCLSQGMCVFRSSSNLIPAFLIYVLNGSVGRQQAIRAAVGAAHPHINLGDIKAYSIPFPTLPVQKQIVASLDALSIETRRLESLYRQKQAALAALKKSLLHQAFGGGP